MQKRCLPTYISERYNPIQAMQVGHLSSETIDHFSLFQNPGVSSMRENCGVFPKRQDLIGHDLQN